MILLHTFAVQSWGQPIQFRAHSRRRKSPRMMKFTPGVLTVRRPLLSASTCATLIDQPVPAIFNLVEEGKLRMAWNISHDLAAHAACLRITARSVQEYLEDPTQLRTEAPDALAREAAELFPSICSAYSLPEVARTLNCSPDQITKLVRGRYLTVHRAGRVGRGNAALITRTSCVSFLISRRVL